jgi:hypothetical protein
VPDARQGHGGAVAHVRIVIDAEHGDLFWNAQARVAAGVDHVGGQAVVVGEDGRGPGEAGELAYQPAPPRGPVLLPDAAAE